MTTNLQPSQSLSEDTSDIKHVASLIRDWRENKKYASDPIPDKIKPLVFRLISSQNYTTTILSKTLLLTYSQLKSIKTQFSNDTPDKQRRCKTTPSDNNGKVNNTINPEPAMLPFKIVPHNHSHSNNNSNLNDIDNYSCNISATNDAISITTTNGAHLIVPIALSSELLLNIIKLFLCSK